MRLVAASVGGHDVLTIKFLWETKEEFDAKYSDSFNHYQTWEYPETGMPLYFPWKD